MVKGIAGIETDQYREWSGTANLEDGSISDQRVGEVADLPRRGRSYGITVGEVIDA